TGGAGVDTADLSQLQNGVVVLMPNNGFVFGIGALRSVSEFENVIGTAFRDEVVTNADDNVIDTGAGNDVITVSAGQDVLRLGAGDDRLTITTAIEAGTQAFGGEGRDAVSLTSVSQDMDLRGIEITGFEVFQGGFTEVRHTLTAAQAAQFEAFALFEDINLDVVMDGATSFDLSNTVVQSLFDRDTDLGLRIFADAVDQTITGSARAETVVFDGVRADFAILHIDATQVLVSGPGDVLHTLNDIEVLEFDDTSLVIGTPNTVPVFTPPPVDLITASVGGSFTIDLAALVNDADGDTLVFSNLNIERAGGFDAAFPAAALSVDANGVLTVDMSLSGAFNASGFTELLLQFGVSDGAHEVGAQFFADLLVLGDPIVGNAFGDEIAPGDTFGGVTVDGADGLDDTILGEGGPDIIDGGLGDDIIFGGAGFDTLFGAEGDDVIFGDAGADLIFGAAGDDRLTGGEGADIFVFRASDGAQSDTIGDFTVGEDKIDISAFMRVQDHLDLVLRTQTKTDPFTSILLDTSPTRGNASSARLQVQMREFNSGSDDVFTRLTFEMQDPLIGAERGFTRFDVDLEGISAAELTVEDFIF
ncbi:MAG: M10 family metallopeptidase C-terminal domain-containing protein, partial [Pseudomonadota bacterium]